MGKIDDTNIEKRIEKDIVTFYSNMGNIEKVKDKESLKVIELAKMYASDAKSYLTKKDFYTSFSCISYAHGLLDAITQISSM
jgi:uncharacterized protein